MFSFLSTAYEYLGAPIECYTEEDNPTFVTSFCWVTRTYTLQLIGKTQGDALVYYQEKLYHRYIAYCIIKGERETRKTMFSKMH